MAKVYPKTLMICNSSSYLSSEGKTFTVWMKSLVMHSNGCTVFDSDGEVVFRVDNYQKRFSSEVFLMNFNGQVLFSIKRKKLLIFRSWKGFRWTNSKFHEEGEWFSVRRKCRPFGREVACHVIQGYNKTAGSCYKMVGLERKSTLKIVDYGGQTLAEVKQKQSLAGVPLGDDVLSLTIESQIDQSLVMALVIVHGMINHKL